MLLASLKTGTEDKEKDNEMRTEESEQPIEVQSLEEFEKLFGRGS